MKTFVGSTSGRALIKVARGLESFLVYWPHSGTPVNVAETLAVVAKSGDCHDPGQVAADIVAAVSQAVRARLVCTTESEQKKFMARSDAYYVVATDTPVTTNVGVYQALGTGINGQTLFYGTIDKFREWAAGHTGLEHVKGKVVQFKYKGGSHPGEVRTIRVEDIVRENGGVNVVGYDLAVGDLKRGYRKYHAERIDGGITVIN